MSDTPEKNEYFQDHLVVRHPSGKSEKFPMPDDEAAVIRIGRELDNDIVLTDARSSRYHAEIRRQADGLQIKDLNSANGTLLGVNRIKPDTWEKMTTGQTVQLGETRLFWEKAASSQSTVAMPLHRPAAAAAAVAATTPAAPPPVSPQNILPWAIGGGIVLLLLILLGLGWLLGWFGGGGEQVAGQPTSQATPGGRATDGSLAQQTPGNGLPTDTPTPSGPQLAIPVVNLIATEVRPIVLGALPSTDKALLLINVRIENVGNVPFTVSTDDFSVRSRDGQTLTEAGGTTSEEGLRRLGVKDRFDDLNLTPGGSVPESLIFEVGAEDYDAELVFSPPNVDPIVLGLGLIQAGRELAVALGTPVADETPVAVAAATPTQEPTPTATRPAAIPAPQVVSRSALVGTIAYPVFNGDDFDLYLGQVNGSGTRFYRGHASQPAFNADGARIAFHSWAGDSRGLVTMDVSGANPKLIANFVEDQLPTWTADGKSVVLLSRRTGGRQSQLIKVDAFTELDEGVILGEGEYPSIGATGQLAFKGWGNTAYGLRLATASLENIQTVTNVDEDTAPALSPDGSKIVFMSRREENWDIYVINVDGSGMQRLTDDPANDGLPTWSPDGNAIAFMSNRGGPWAVWAMTPDGKGMRQLFTMEGSPDGFVGTDTYASRGWAEERISWTSAELE
ncbi:MAG: FHA domain-containing protein [Chloroflexota bacterium]